MYRIVDADYLPVVQKYAVSPLAAKQIACASLSEEQIGELLDPSAVLHTSGADCVLKCCERILQAQKNREKVFVGGDYDADGICSTAIMKYLLDRLGIENGYYIPDRFKEGYGLSARTVEMVKQKGYDLIITVDNGVKAHEALRKAQELDLEVIVTDHHRIEEEIEAGLVVHPDYMEPEFEYLSGAGVVLQISRNILGSNDLCNSLAAVALIGDVMPLWKQTRQIVKTGLSNLQRHEPYPLYALLYPGAPADASSVSFQIVPKLNSLGRMNDISNVNTLIPYLLSENAQVIGRFAAQINSVNDRRRQLSEIQTEQARRLCAGDGIEVIADPSFHEGICGLAAGHLADELKKPVLVFAENGGLMKGSGRSVEGFDMFEFFSGFSGLSAFGGHAMAVGMSVKKEDFEDFRARVKEAYDGEKIVPQDPERTAVKIGADEVHLQNIYDLYRMDPFPKELQDIAFAVPYSGAHVTYSSDKVIRYTVPNRYGGFEAVLYTRKKIRQPEHPEWLIGTLSVNRFRGQVTPQLIIDSIQ